MTDKIRMLVQELQSDDFAVRAKASKDLLDIGEPAFLVLVDCLRDANARLREAAARQLGKFKDSRATQPLMVILQDTSTEARYAAIWALGEIGDALAVRALIETLQDASPETRMGASYALGRIGGSTESIELQHETLQALATVLNDANARVRYHAAGALGEIKTLSAIELLIAALDESDRNFMYSVAGSLAKMGETAVEPLISALEGSSSAVRSGVALALGILGDARAVEHLIPLLEDQDVQVAISAAEALGGIGDARATLPLIDTLRNPDWSIRRAAAETLGVFGDERAVEPLITVMYEDELSPREAVRALAAIGSPKAIPALIDALSSEDHHLIVAAAEGLVSIGKQAVEPLIGRLGEMGTDIKISIVDILGKIGDRQAIPGLETLLYDENSVVRACAQRALERVRGSLD